MSEQRTVIGVGALRFRRFIGRTRILSAGAIALCSAVLMPRAALGQAGSYQQTNIVSDGSVSAQITDPTLINPWGVAVGSQTPFWINDAGSGLSAVYTAAGVKQFAVTVPPHGGSTAAGKPSGIAYNPSGSAFMVPDGSAATFIFVTLDGTISGWNASAANAILVADNSASGASYTGAAIAAGNGGSLLFAADFGRGRVDVFDSQFNPTTVSGGFADPNLPAGYAPFGIHNVNGMLYVTYAQAPSSPGPAVTGAGLGYVDEFDATGTLQARVATMGTLNAPWGVALAPSGFGAFGGDLLVGNFGDGAITAFDPVTFAPQGQLQDGSGNVIANDGLWELLFGSMGTGDPNTLYFSAGVNDEKGGLFGSITPQTAAVTGDFALSPASSTLTVQTGQSATMDVSLSAVNGFDGTVALSCSGLPSGATCSLAPASVTLSGMTASSVLTVAVGSTAGSGGNPYRAGNRPSGNLPLAAGVFAPGILLLTLFLRKRRQWQFLFPVAILMLLAASMDITGCGGSSGTGSGSSTPVSSFTLAITGTSGSLSHTSQVVVSIN